MFSFPQNYLELYVVAPPDGELLEEGGDIVCRVDVVLHSELVPRNELGHHHHLGLLPPHLGDLVLDEGDLDLVLVDDILDDCWIEMNTGPIGPSSS